MNNWGGSGIEKITFDYISNKISHGSTFVELGAGKVSTREFSKVFDLYSVEQNQEYCGLYSPVNYIHASIKNGWYDVDVLKDKLPKNISGIFVDGPLGTGNRRGFLENVEIFDLSSDAMIIFHDTYRDEEYKLAEEVANKLNFSMKSYSNGDYYVVVSNRDDM
jgi:hypothetical protein